MKLRIRGNSIRLRVSKSELDRVAETGVTEDVVRFAPHAALRYRLEVKPSGAVEAYFDGAAVRVVVPQDLVDRWLSPDEVAIEGEQRVDGGEVLRILVEKDYTCLTPRSGEDDADLFANPQKTPAKLD